MNWRALAIFTPLLFVMYQTISKTLPKGISIFLVNAYASLIGVLVMLSLHMLTAPKKSPVLDSKYLPAALGIGLLISLGNFGIIKAYSLGAPQSVFTLLFYVALIIYGVIFGLLLWHERLNIMQVLGLALALGGLFLMVYFRK